ncbi:MAG: lysophospholipid acyltransferase family protein [Methylacidiphilales bacterium]|nr:lysophospholipid acyltransferase family protein [Candidatus Methylacidiphilales bacterium]
MNRLLVWFSSLVLRLVGSTLRMSVEDRGGIIDHPDHPPVIIAFWHNRMALMSIFYRRYCRGRTCLTFISRSRDGQFITDVVAHFGIKAVRGSSSRHGTSAMLAAIRASHDQRVDLTITPDGPRGPRYQIQPGLVRLAQATQRPIVPVTYDLKWKLRLKSWDRFLVPLPFSTCHLVTGDPILVPEDASEAELASINARIAEALGGD